MTHALLFAVIISFALFPLTLGPPPAGDNRWQRRRANAAIICRDDAAWRKANYQPSPRPAAPLWTWLVLIGPLAFSALLVVPFGWWFVACIGASWTISVLTPLAMPLDYPVTCVLKLSRRLSADELAIAAAGLGATPDLTRRRDD